MAKKKKTGKAAQRVAHISALQDIAEEYSKIHDLAYDESLTSDEFKARVLEIFLEGQK